MSFFTNLRADRLIAEIKAAETGNGHRDLLDKLTRLAPPALPRVIDALANADKNETAGFVVQRNAPPGVPVTTSYPHPLYRNALFEDHPHRVCGCLHAEAYCREGIWLPHQALLAEPGWIHSVIDAFIKVRSHSGSLASTRS